MVFSVSGIEFRSHISITSGKCDVVLMCRGMTSTAVWSHCGVNESAITCVKKYKDEITWMLRRMLHRVRKFVPLSLCDPSLKIDGKGFVGMAGRWTCSVSWHHRMRCIKTCRRTQSQRKVFLSSLRLIFNSPPCTLWLLINLTTFGKEHRRLASEPSLNIVVFFSSYFSYYRA